MRRIAVLIACLALAAPASAGAATAFVVAGGGDGHGIGMSQYGAYGYGLHGWSYGRILAHYYRGTTLGTVQSRDVRVLLQSAGAVSFSGASNLNGVRIDPRQAYTATLAGSGIAIADGHGRTVVTFGPGAVFASGGTIRLLGTAVNGVSGGAYRGQLELIGSGGAIDAIDVVSLEDYVAGVVPAEIEASWPAETLKAQAVAARTYALATDAGGSLFDQYADTRSQEYKGLSGEATSSTAAVRATAGQVVVWHGALAVTNFFSTSGGRTEDVQNVFYGSRPQPYLVSVADPYDTLSPTHRWSYRLSPAEIDARLAGVCQGGFAQLEHVRRGASPRIVSATVGCGASHTHVSGVELRQALGLTDTWIHITRVSSAAVRRAHGASALARIVLPARALTGVFDPPPPGQRLNLERRVHGRYTVVEAVTVAADGTYLAPIAGAGTYRVGYGSAYSDPVVVR